MPESSRRIFLSYGHDETATLAQRLVSDLRDHGHEVWFDEQLRAGSDWEHALELALEWAAEAADLGRVIFLITPHSARRPDGYCLNELARAIDLGLPVVPVMVVWCKPPLSIARLQWVDLQAADQYERRFGQLCEALETGIVEFEGTQSRLLRVLEPLSFEADVAQSLPSFVGREWIFDRLDDWLADKRGSSVYLLTGEPGIGKTALAIKIRDRYPQVAAYHLCRYGDSEKANPVRAICSIAYQLSTQLPEYRQRLLEVLPASIDRFDPLAGLVDRLLVQPLASVPEPGRPLVVLIDALDEAAAGVRNPFAEALAREWPRLPSWLRLLVLSRAEAHVTQPLQAWPVLPLDPDSSENKADLRAYLTANLEPSHAHALNEIMSRGEGNFLYAKCVLDDQDALADPAALERLPSGIGGIFHQMFSRQFSDLERYERDIRPALETILSSPAPVDLARVGQLCGWDDYDRDRFVRGVGPLVDTDGSPVTLFHKSLSDWLLDPSAAGEWAVSVRSGCRRWAESYWEEFQAGAHLMSAEALMQLPHYLVASQRWADLIDYALDRPSAEMFPARPAGLYWLPFYKSSALIDAWSSAPPAWIGRLEQVPAGMVRLGADIISHGRHESGFAMIVYGIHAATRIPDTRPRRLFTLADVLEIDGFNLPAYVQSSACRWEVDDQLPAVLRTLCRQALAKVGDEPRPVIAIARLRETLTELAA